MHDGICRSASDVFLIDDGVCKVFCFFMNYELSLSFLSFSLSFSFEKIEKIEPNLIIVLKFVENFQVGKMRG